jgi:hypothetical protein
LNQSCALEGAKSFCNTICQERAGADERRGCLSNRLPLLSEHKAIL